jgi:peptidoglycan/LPS O-acetylase OafA/YrhL
MKRQNGTTERTWGGHYVRVGWTLMVIALLAIAVPLIATAAKPHAVWLFTTSYGLVAMVVGVAFIRVGHRPDQAFGRRRSEPLEGCR